MKKRPVLVIFIVVQLLGLVCLALWERAPAALSMPMWGTSLITLFPGNMLGSWLIQTLFWETGMSLTWIGLLSAGAGIIINGIIWFSVVKVARIIYTRLFIHSGSNEQKV